MLPNNTFDRVLQDKSLGPTVLVVDDQEADRKRLSSVLSATKQARSIRTIFKSNLESALETLAETTVHVVLLDKNLGPSFAGDPKKNNGIEAIEEMLQLQPHLQILVVTGSNDEKDSERAMALGAFGIVKKETPNSLLIQNVTRAIEVSELSFRNSCVLRSQPIVHGELGGRSKAFQDVLALTQLMAESNRPVLLEGEPGTGKSAIAKWIHDSRTKFFGESERPYFRINSAALAADVIESELFGHERGAFTDASSMRQGYFELANNGTLFFDEIGELPLELQPKLLTVIDSGEFFRVGGKKKMKSCPKLIFATNRDLKQMVADGTFRRDLYERISAYPIRMPNLSERSEDIPDIVRALLPKVSRENNVTLSFEEIPQDFIDYLMTAPIEGNIRGIEHQLDRLLLLSPKDAKRRLFLEGWRSISGFDLRKKRQSSGSQRKEREQLSLKDMLSLPFDITGEGFPGLSEFLDIVRDKVVQEVIAKHERPMDRVRALGAARSHAYTLISRVLAQDGIVPTHVRPLSASDTEASNEGVLQ